MGKRKQTQITNWCLNLKFLNLEEKRKRRGEGEGKKNSNPHQIETLK